MIKYKPPLGTLLLCDYKGSIAPEMNKKRPVVVLNNQSHNLCTVVPLSTTAPEKIEAWHYLLHTPDPLPDPYDETSHWVKGDMISAVSYERLFLPFSGKDKNGKRIYVHKVVSDKDFQNILDCVSSVFKPK